MASKQPAVHPLAGMTSLSPQVWFRDTLADDIAAENITLAAAAASSGPPPPRVVIIASWMGARDVHIAKYIVRYRALFPTAAIMLLKFDPAQLWSSKAGSRAAGPAVTFLKSKMLSSPSPSSSSSSSSSSSEPNVTPPQLLIHLFSNGGATTLQNLYLEWQSSCSSLSATPTPFPASVAIYDSAPGTSSLQRTYRAFAVSVLPKQLILRLVAAPMLYGVCFLAWLYIHVVLKRILIPLRLVAPGRDDTLSKNLRVLNDCPGLTGRQTLRTYIYSKEDEMIYWRDVEKHAGDAVTAGSGFRSGGGKEQTESDHHQRSRIPCQLEMFYGSGHVAHMRHDPDRYWKIVVDTWEKGTRGN